MQLEAACIGHHTTFKNSRSSTGSTSPKESKQVASGYFSPALLYQKYRCRLHVSMCYIGTESHVIPVQFTALHTRDVGTYIVTCVWTHWSTCTVSWLRQVAEPSKRQHALESFGSGGLQIAAVGATLSSNLLCTARPRETTASPHRK